MAQLTTQELPLAKGKMAAGKHVYGVCCMPGIVLVL